MKMINLIKRYISSSLRDPITGFPRRHTALRIFNLFLNQISRRIFKSTYVFGYPLNASIESTNFCNLNCPMCSTNKDYSDRKQEKIDWQTYKKVIDEIGRYLYVVGPFNLGEPLLHEQIFEMIAYAGKSNISTILSTNGNLINEKVVSQMFDSGLEKLIISIDAATEETYNKNRPGGNFKKLLEDVKLLVAEKKRKKLLKPYIAIMMIVMKNNEHEIDKFKELADELGVDKCLLSYYWEQNLGDSVGERTSRTLAMKKNNYKSELDPDSIVTDTCRWAWSGCVINWDGRVVPCCFDYKETYVLGNLEEQSFKSIWNNKKYRKLRRLIKQGREQPLLCNKCPMAY